MSSNASRSTFPGHFPSSSSPSPPSSPSYQPGQRESDHGQRLQVPLAADRASGSDLNLPGAYPTSPQIPPRSGSGGMLGAGADASMRGAMHRLTSGDVDATRSRGTREQGSAPDHRGTPEGGLGSKDTTVEETEKSVGSMTVNDDSDRSTAEENCMSSFFSLCFSPAH